jgi:tetrahydromethanopterin S-methyltransferase subunit C
MFVGVLLLLGQERHGMLAPMTEWVEMVRCMVAIVVAIAVALLIVSTMLAGTQTQQYLQARQ